jgi:hypothetical protein
VWASVAAKRLTVKQQLPLATIFHFFDLVLNDECFVH